MGSVFIFLLLLLVVVFVSSDDPYNVVVSIDKTTCRTVASLPLPKSDITSHEECSLCELIILNSREWQGWRYNDDMASLCNKVPEHLQEMCHHYACKLHECSNFNNLMCYSPYFKMQPCTAKWICRECLQVPRSPYIRGCFDRLHTY